MGLGEVLGDPTLHLRDDIHGVWAGLVVLRWPQTNGGVVQGLPQRSKLLAAGSVKGPDRRGPCSHCKLGGGSSSKAETTSTGPVHAKPRPP
jgi:hypothetical protein